MKKDEIKIRMATEAEEKITDAIQPLLEIAEGKRDIETWNDRVMNLLDVIKSQNIALRQSLVKEVEGKRKHIEENDSKTLIWLKQHLNWQLDDILKIILQEKE